MSIIIRAVYPCISCQVEIPSEDKFCKHCGAKQNLPEDSLRYNIFYRKTGRDGAFNILFGGSPIRTLEDIIDLARNHTKASGYDYFLGSSLASDQQQGGFFRVRLWVNLALIDGFPGLPHLNDDQNALQITEIQITNLE